MLFLIFFPATSEEVDLSSSTATLTNSPPPKRRDQVIVGFTTLVVLFVVGITSIALVAAYPHHTQNWANFLGTVAGILAMIQYIPQIYYTWRLGEIRSLSILTMLIQVPGAFLFAFSLWLRVGWEGWSTWLMFLVTGVLQGVLFGLAVSYWWAQRNSSNDGEEEEAESTEGSTGPSLADDVDGANEGSSRPTERTALLREGGRRGKDIPWNTFQSDRTTSSTGHRSLSMLYSATPPENDSDPSSEGRS